MKAIVVAASALVWIAPAAHADVWTDYLQVECDAKVANFSVRPRFGYVEPGSLKPNTWIEVRQGVTVSDDGKISTAPGSDLFANCLIGKMAFEVVRTSVSAPNLCTQGCITGSARFEIRLNGRVVAEGQVGYEQENMIETVVYDGDQLFVCDTINRHFRDKKPDGTTQLNCRASYAR